MDGDVLFTDEERQRLILAYVEGTGGKGCTTAEIKEFVRWCEETAVAATLIELVIKWEVLPFKNEQGTYSFTARGEVS